MKRIKKVIPGFIIALLVIYSAINAQTQLVAEESNRSELGWVAKWFAAWELMNKELFYKRQTILNKLDNIFLSMEGLGQYMAVAWLTHPKGGNMNYNVAVTGFRRGKKQWSQDEGLAMFLLLTKLTNPDWANDMFCLKKPSKKSDTM